LAEAKIGVHVHRRTFLEKASKLYYNTHVNLNFNCGDITSNRVMRIMASRGFCLSQANADIKHTFTNGEELVWWDEPEGQEIDSGAMIDLARKWLADEQGRLRVAEAGYEFAKEFTWVNQMEKIVRFVGGEAIPADGAAQPYIDVETHD
jgi:spore maturation protein CgeB